MDARDRLAFRVKHTLTMSKILVFPAMSAYQPRLLRKHNDQNL
jgi:hypothetical protein